MLFIGILGLMFLIATFLQDFGVVPKSSEIYQLKYSVLGWVMFLAYILHKRIEDVEEKLNGMAKGKAPQGTREQERPAPRQEGRPSQAGRLAGHWHKPDRYHQTAYDAWWCPNRLSTRVPEECPSRDPRSTG